jgi:hypothetical protein
MSNSHPPQPLPPGVDRWNWGAFFLNWIWGLGNNTFIALLALVPLVGFVVMFVLGAKGSEWAWRNKHWESVEHFRRVQRNWAVAGLIAWVVVIGSATAGIYGVVNAVRSSDIYREALSKAQASAQAVELLGAPIQGGFPSGNFRMDDLTGEAALAIPVTGSKATGTIYVEAMRDMGAWKIERLELAIDGSEQRIDLNTGRHVLPPSPSDETASLDRLAHVGPA